MESQEYIKAACPLSIGGANPPDERKEGDINGYIFGYNPILYIHCRSCRIVLYNLWEKEIAAHYSQ